MKRLQERFIRYVKIDTQSDPNSTTFPSTLKQLDLSKLLVEEILAMGFDARLDKDGYVYAKIDSNIDKKVPSIGFIAHVDTSPDAPGKGVNPRIIKNYDGSLIKLNDTFQMHPDKYPSLKKVIGEDIIVTDGNTLLGADDKAGVAEIMELLHRITDDKTIKHGDIYICFTPDEEIGQGADRFDYDWFKADFAYTLDGSEVGGIEYENFNAASADVTFIGNSIHPGSAKNKMINALHLQMEFHSMLPKFLDPAITEGYEGFNHLSNVVGQVEEASAHYIIRNHHMTKFLEQQKTFEAIKNYMNEKYGYEAVVLNIKESYLNMYEIIKDHMYVIDYAVKATKAAGLTPKFEAIRGGTDGARLTYGGLICPNLGTGAYHFHGRLEFASINQMEKAVEVMFNIIKEVQK